ncbi:cysteine hydrolase family protein [Amycolatopsis sp. NPDC051903]|uniref:cysteine hydrolase family protein n=1 Tax=Amycolatopsis sp. NPDC051903 TaxID=3363936 RepID=UPI0037BDA6CF
MKPLLTVIDLQNIFGEPDSEWFTPRFAEIVPRIRRLVGAFGARVAFTRFLAPEQPAGAWVKYYEQWPFALQPADSRAYAVIDEFPVESTVDSNTFGKWTPELAALAGDGGLVLAGVSTDCCVLSTALAAADAGAPVTVVADACAGVSDESHERTLEILRLYGPLVNVATTDEMLAG